MDDPDAMAAVGKVWVHWVVWHIIPDANDFPEVAPDTMRSRIFSWIAATRAQTVTMRD